MKKALLISSLILVTGASIVVAQAFASDEPTMCTMDYTPVCASVQVQCFKAPCNPVQETFWNACTMKASKNATFLYSGECKNILADTKWNIQSFDDKVASGANISFQDNTISAHVCNVFNGSYSLEGNTFVVGPMISTKMACLGELDTYERAFDLSGATFELSTEGGNHMMITTVAGHKFQWTKDEPIIGMPNPASVYCAQNSGTLIIVDTFKDWSKGWYSLCAFPDGSKCEEWSYFRGECKPVATKLQSVMDSFLSIRKFSEEWYKKFFGDLKQTIDLNLASATWTLKTSYSQIAAFLKSY